MDHSHHDHAHMHDMETTTPMMDTMVVSDGSTVGPMTHDHTSHVDHSAHAGHSMSFHVGLKEMVLFEFWQTTTTGGMILSCLVVILLCFVMEATRWARAKREAVNKINNANRKTTVTPHRIIDSLLHAIQLTISYLLMLVFMTFNLWLCVATVVGEVLARLLFTSFLPVDSPAVEEGCCN